MVRDLKKELLAAIPEDDEDAQAKLKTYYETLRDDAKVTNYYATEILKNAGAAK